MSIKEIPYHYVTETKSDFYDGIEYDIADEINYNNDIEINRQIFKDQDDEPIYNYYDPY